MYLTVDCHGYVHRTDGWRWSYQDRWGRAGAEVDIYLIARDHELPPQTAIAFITWVVSARDLIGQFLKLAFRSIFAGIRHGGSEESIDAVRRHTSKWVTDCFTQSADVPDRPSHSVPSKFREVKDFGVRSAPEQADARKDGGRRKSVTDKQYNEHLSRPPMDESGHRSWRACLRVAVRKDPLLSTNPTVSTSKPISFTGNIPYGPSYLQSRSCQIDVVFVRPTSMGSSFYPRIRLRRGPPEFPDESSNVSSLRRSATADITRPPAVIKMTSFVDLYRYRESGEPLRFKGCAKSQYMGFTVKMFKCIGSQWVPPSVRLAPFSILAPFPLLCRNHTFLPSSSACPP